MLAVCQQYPGKFNHDCRAQKHSRNHARCTFAKLYQKYGKNTT